MKNKEKVDKKKKNKCISCGSRIYVSGPLVGQCSNSKCKQEHTVIMIIADDTLSDAQYKDFYG